MPIMSYHKKKRLWLTQVRLVESNESLDIIPDLDNGFTSIVSFSIVIDST